MVKFQIVIPSIESTYEQGYVLFNFPEGAKKIFLCDKEKEAIADYFQGKYKLPTYNEDLLLQEDGEGKYFFIKIMFGKVFEGHRVSFVEGLLLENDQYRNTKIFQERRGMLEGKIFVPVDCQVDLRRGTHRSGLIFRSGDNEFILELSLQEGALVAAYQDCHHIDLSLESEDPEGSNGALIFFVREYCRNYAGDFLRAKICYDSKKRACLILESQNENANFKFNIITGLILAQQLKVEILIDQDFFENTEESKREEEDILGLD